jgi:hypothetical protein
MVHKLFDGLRVVLAKTTQRDDLLLYAQTEYGADWRYAYNYMLNNSGQGPKVGLKIDKGEWV